MGRSGALSAVAVETHRSDHPLVIGLTGGIGSGKSVVLADLVSLGAEGIDADRMAHEVMAPNGPAYAPIVAEFGATSGAGRADRPRPLGSACLSPIRAKLARLEAIVHPVGEAIAACVAASQAPVVAIEAISLRAGLSRRLCDEVWVNVPCSLRQQIACLRASRGMPLAEAHRRMAADADAADDRAGPPRHRHRVAAGRRPAFRRSPPGTRWGCRYRGP